MTFNIILGAWLCWGVVEFDRLTKSTDEEIQQAMRNLQLMTPGMRLVASFAFVVIVPAVMTAGMVHRWWLCVRLWTLRVRRWWLGGGA